MKRHCSGEYQNYSDDTNPILELLSYQDVLAYILCFLPEYSLICLRGVNSAFHIGIVHHFNRILVKDDHFQIFPLYNNRNFRDFFLHQVIPGVIKQKKLSLIEWIYPLSKENLSNQHVECIARYGNEEIIRWAYSKNFFSDNCSTLLYISAAEEANLEALKTFHELEIRLPGSLLCVNSQKRLDLYMEEAFEFIKKLSAHKNDELISWASEANLI